MAGASLKQELFSVIHCLTKLKIDYAIIGGIALAIWAKPRTTYDIDLLTSITKENVDLYLKLLKAHFIVPQEKPIEFKYITFLRMLTKKGVTVIDLIFADDLYKKNALLRKVQLEVGNRKMNFISPEDLIIFKILSGREQDRLDIKDIFEHQRNSLNLKYLKEWFKKLKLERSINEYFGR